MNDPRFTQNPDGSYGPNHTLFPPSKRTLLQEKREAEANAFAKRHPKPRVKERRDRNADRVDGYDRDDIGLSPDY